jgi:hypothetical protein
VSVNLTVLEDILLIIKISDVQLVMQSVKLATVQVKRIVSLAKLLLSNQMMVSSTYMMREKKNVTKPVL